MIKYFLSTGLFLISLCPSLSLADSLPTGTFRGTVHGVLDYRASSPYSMTVKITKSPSGYTVKNVRGFTYAATEDTFGFIGITSGRVGLGLNGSCSGVPRLRMFRVDSNEVVVAQDIDYSESECYDADGPFTRQIFTGALRRVR